MESALRSHSQHPVLSPIYQPSVLDRADSLSSDIAYFLGNSDWKSSPLFASLQRAPPPPLAAYVKRLTELAASESTCALLLAHAYVRYLGDLSGGQIIRRRLVKAYDLPATGEGVRFYIFGQGDEVSSASEVRALKDWFRNGMDLGVGENEELKGVFSYYNNISANYLCIVKLVEEAVLVFQLNQDLFTTLQGPKVLPSTTLIPPHLNEKASFLSSGAYWKATLKPFNHYITGSIALACVIFFLSNSTWT